MTMQLAVMRGSCLAWVAVCVAAFHQSPESSRGRHRSHPSIGHSIAAITTLHSSLNNDSDMPPRDVESMQEWAAYYGVQVAEGVQLVPSIDDNGVDFGFVATQDLSANSPVLFVPSNMILSSTAAYQELAESTANDNGLQQAQELLQQYGMAKYLDEFWLYIKLLVQVEQGDESPWLPWFHSLPTVYYNGASMTNLCFECLPPLAASLAREERSKSTYFRQALQRIDSNLVSDEIKDNKDLTTWAFQVVCTRSFEDGGDRRIAPMADMFNHGTETEIILSHDEEGNCYAFTTRDVPAGSPLRMSYGDPTNPSFFLARYGFLDESSPASFCKILIPKPTRQLVNMGYEHSQMLFYRTGEVSQQVYDVLLYQILDREDRETQQVLYDAHMKVDLDTKFAIHQHYSDQTLAALNKHVDQFLRELDELSVKAAGKDIQEHPRLPLILRHNEFVRETFETVKSRLTEVAV